MQKNFPTFLILLLKIIITTSYYIKESINHPEITITNFTFGSGYYGRYTNNKNIFKTINKHNSNLFIFLGNIVNINKPDFFFLFKNTIKNNWTLAEKFYKKAKDEIYYKKISKEKPIIGIWDEYDYGIKNGNKYYKDKEISKKLFLNFLNFPKDNELYNLNRGLYTTYSFGNNYKSIRIILLDLRFYKSSFFSIFSDNLGKKQWIWLENIFKNYNETLTFIGSSIQFLPINRILTENWFIKSREKLFNLISKYKKNGIIFLSGNVNFAQITKTFCIHPKIGYNLYEITSSNLGYHNYFKVSYFIDKILPNDYNINKSFDGINFGEIIINWGNSINDIVISINIFDENDNKKISLDLNYNKDLVFKRENIDNIDCIYLLNKRFKTPFQYFNYYMNNKNELPIGFIYLFCIMLLIQIFLSKKNILIFFSILILVFSIFIGFYYKIDIEKEKNFLQ